jgi:AhpD family alkylhydroperoxidase
MEARINVGQVDPEAINTLVNAGKYVWKCGLEQSLVDLIQIRVSQINHCAYCLDMHVKDAAVSGETEQRMHGLNAWRETPYYTDRERAALAWTEAVTLITDGFVPDEVYAVARTQFSEKELIALTMAIININAWNRLNVSFRNVPGGYVSQRKPAAVSNAIPEIGESVKYRGGKVSQTFAAHWNEFEQRE